MRATYGATLAESLTYADYEELVEAQLQAAASAATPEQRHAHLDRAAVLATEAEASRWEGRD
jgi:hypothetical protein